MPLYTYKCFRCGKVFDLDSSIDGRNNLKDCECGGKAKRDVETELQNCGAFDETTKHERWSYAMGVNKRQIPEAMRLYPGSEYNSKGQLRIKNRNHKLYEAKRRGFIELE